MVVRRRIRKGGGSSPTNSIKVKKKKSAKIFEVQGELSEIIQVINKDHNYGVIRKASDNSLEYGRLRTGILSLDVCLAGGLRLSRGCMFYGEKAAGKSTVALMVCAQAQKAFPDKAAIWIDIEGTFDSKWAAKLGVNNDQLIIIEPETGEEAVDLADSALRAYETSIIVTDSIAFLTPSREIEESAETSLVGVHARLVGGYIRRVNNALLSERHRRHTPIVLHLNQFRMRIGVMFGDPRVLPGGKALEFSTSQQVLLYNKEIQGDGSIVTHNDHSFKITKDKTGGRMKEGKFKLIRDRESTGLPEGYVDQTKTILTYGVEAGIVTGKYDLGKYGRHRTVDAVGKYFINNPEASIDMQNQIINYYREKWDVL